MSIPTRFRTHTVTVTPYEGATPTGADLGAPVSVSGQLEDSDELVLDAAGVERQASAKFFCDLPDAFPVESELTVNGRTLRVIKARRWDTNGSSRLDHFEAWLQ